MKGIIGDPIRLLMLVLIAVAGLALAKQIARLINQPNYLFV